MGKAGSVTLKRPILAGLSAAAGLVLVLSGVSLLAALVSAVSLAALLLWFSRKPRPEGELPCALVSCSHYLGDHEEDRTEQRQGEDVRGKK